MGEAGLVESIHQKTATVVFDRKSACEKCSVCMKHDNKMTIVADNEIGAKPSDIVQVNDKRRQQNDKYIPKIVAVVTGTNQNLQTKIL